MPIVARLHLDYIVTEKTVVDHPVCGPVPKVLQVDSLFSNILTMARCPILLTPITRLYHLTNNTSSSNSIPNTIPMPSINYNSSINNRHIVIIKTVSNSLCLPVDSPLVLPERSINQMAVERLFTLQLQHLLQMIWSHRMFLL